MRKIRSIRCTTRISLRGGLAPPAPEIGNGTSSRISESFKLATLGFLHFPPTCTPWLSNHEQRASPGDRKPSKPIQGGPYPPPTWSTTSRIAEITLPNIPIFRIFPWSEISLTTRSVTSRGSTSLKIKIWAVLYTAIAENFFERSIPLAHTSDRLSNSPRRVILRRRRNGHTFFRGPSPSYPSFRKAPAARQSQYRGDRIKTPPLKSPRFWRFGSRHKKNDPGHEIWISPQKKWPRTRDLSQAGKKMTPDVELRNVHKKWPNLPRFSRSWKIS